MKFQNREEAAQILAVKLSAYKDSNAIILAIPRGGVPLGHALSKTLNLPLELVLSKKIGHPLHKEYAIGAVTLNSRILDDTASNIPSEYIELETVRIRKMLKKRFHTYYGERIPRSLHNQTLIIVDDGIATGNTIFSTVKMLFEEKPKKIIIAVPVASSTAIKKLRNSPFVDEVICLIAPENFMAVGEFYNDFEQVDDNTVIELLNEAHSNYTLAN